MEFADEHGDLWPQAKATEPKARPLVAAPTNEYQAQRFEQSPQLVPITTEDRDAWEQYHRQNPHTREAMRQLLGTLHGEEKNDGYTASL